MAAAESTLDQLREYARETALLASVEALLGWDEQTQLPAEGGAYRAEQMALLAGHLHARRTSAQLGQWLDELADSPLAADRHSDSGATIFHLRRDYDRNRKLPPELVRELSRLAVLGQQAWSQARKKNDFDSFAPLLTKMVHCKQQQAEALGYDDCRYDALLDDYEPECTTAQIQRVLHALRDELTPLIAAIADSGRQPDRGILRRHYPAAEQRVFSQQVATDIGFDFRRGRLDLSDHPFCESLGPSDCRITTRFDEQFLPSALFGVMHEAGHGIYDQGLRGEHYGLPPGQAVSLGIHESQSRLWENIVGRSRPFWEHCFPVAQRLFPQSLANVSLADFYFAVNDVQPTLIRVEADEATYNLHIIVRFELERALLDGDLTVADLPAAWREKYRRYLGIEPSSDSQGVLQDIHWSAGLFGYFPTYSLGNIYAAQMFAQAERELDDLPAMLGSGHFQPLNQWLREKVHRQGRCYGPAQLVESICGQPVSHQPLMDYLRGKLGPLYGL